MNKKLNSRTSDARTGISVVIPTYNRGGLISETIMAVLSQTLAADEIIVVDDGSTDDTRFVLASLNARVRSIRICNSGDLVARNTGLRAARGLLVAFCDSDDIWMPNFLAEMSAQWLTEPKLLACYSNFWIMENGIVAEQSKFEAAPNGFWTGLRVTNAHAGVFNQSIIDRLLAFQPFFPSCMMVSRTEFIGLGGWDEEVSRIVGCDLATTLRVAARPPLGVVRRPLVKIRKHANNFSGNTEKMNLGDARVLEHVLRTRPELSSLASAIRASVAARRCQALDNAFSRRDFAAVREIYRLLPEEFRPRKQRAKRLVAGLPAPIGGLAAALLSS